MVSRSGELIEAVSPIFDVSQHEGELWYRDTLNRNLVINDRHCTVHYRPLNLLFAMSRFTRPGQDHIEIRDLRTRLVTAGGEIPPIAILRPIAIEAIVHFFVNSRYCRERRKPRHDEPDAMRPVP